MTWPPFVACWAKARQRGMSQTSDSIAQMMFIQDAVDLERGCL